MDAAVQSGELGNAVHQLGYFRPKAYGKLVQRHFTIFNNVVKQRGRDGLFVQTKIAKVESDFHRVRDVGFAGLAQLPVVAAVSVVVGVLDEPGGVIRQVGGHPFQEFAYSVLSSYPKVYTPVR